MTIRYWAFISYSHKDAQLADRLQRKLEQIVIPEGLNVNVSPPRHRRLYPIFRDRTDARAGSLHQVIEDALRASRSLVVIATDHGRRSDYVSFEIRRFEELHGEGSVLVVGDGGDRASLDAWIVQHFIKEPLYVDLQWDGFENVVFKIGAGILGCETMFLQDRERVRKTRTYRLISSIAVAVAVVMTVLAVLAALARQEAQERRHAAQVAEALADERAYRANLTATRTAIVTSDIRGADMFLEAARESGRKGWEQDVLAANTHAELRSFRASTTTLRAIAADPEGVFLYTLDLHGLVRAWTRDTFELVAETTGARVGGRALCTGFGGAAVFEGQGGTVVAWRPDTDSKIIIPFPDSVGRERTVVALDHYGGGVVGVTTGLGDHFYVGSGNGNSSPILSEAHRSIGTVVQSACLGGTEQASNLLLCGADGALGCVSFKPEGNILAWTDQWSSGMIMAAHISSDATLAAYGDHQGWLYLHDLQTGDRRHVVRAHAGTLYQIRSDGIGRFWTCGRDGTVACWDRDGRLVARLNGHRAIATDLAYTESVDRLYSCDESGMVLEWDPTRTVQPGVDLRPSIEMEEGLFKGYSTTATEYCFDGEHTVLAIRTAIPEGCSIATIDLRSRRVTRRSSFRESRRVHGFIGDSIVYSAPDFDVHQGEPGTLAIKAEFPDRSAKVLLDKIPMFGPAIDAIDSVSGCLVLSAVDGRVVIWRGGIAAPQVVNVPAILGGDKTRFHSRLSRSGTLLAVNSMDVRIDASTMPQRDPLIAMIDVERREVVARLEFGSPVACFAWDPSSQSLWISTHDKTIQHLDLDGNAIGPALEGLPAKKISSLAHHPTEKRLVVGNDDGTLAVWDTSTGRHVVDLDVLLAGAYSIDFSFDGSILCASTVVGELRFWTDDTWRVESER